MAETRVVRAVCSHDCPDSCAVLVTVDTASQRAIKVQGDPTHPVTQGFLCGKVAKYLDRVYSPERLLYPMRRRAGVPKGPVGYGGVKGREAEAFERIGWDEALDLIAARLGAIRDQYGPESILPYSYAGTIGKLGFGSMDRRFFHRLGASQLDRTICSEAGGQALTQVYGVRLGVEPQQFAHAGLILAWGANIHGNNIHLWPFVQAARRQGARLVVLDPYRTRTAAAADEHIAVRPGTDGLLALSMMHVILQQGLEDRAYLDRCTHGFAELRAHALLPEHAPEAAARVTGVAADTIERLAVEYATCWRRTGRAAVIRLNYGVQRSENGGTAVRAVAMLPLLTGAWQQLGGGLQLSTSGAFPFANEALQMPGLMHSSPLARPARVVNMSALGHALTELGSRAGDGPPVKALFVYNSNPAAVAPNQNAVLRGLQRDDLFTVVHEQFLTDTADYADVVLPAPTFLETKDVQGAYGHYFVQLSQPAIAPLGEAWSNVRLFAALAKRMGFEESCFAEDEDTLIDQALASGHAWFGGVTRQQLERDGRMEMQLPRAADGSIRPFADASWFRTPSGRGELVPVPVFRAPQESRANATEFPLEFLPRKADNYMNSTFTNTAVHRQMEADTEEVLEISAEDAAARGIQHGDPVEVWNSRGRIVLRAAVTSTVGAGVVAATLDRNRTVGPATGNVNALTSERLTDLGAGATFYSTLVEVRRVVPEPLRAANR
ncbi:MAG: molybdopterin-dependent oxidoreductase [Acidobacteriota bacterium]|nr:molybdopterin-dependent oxidoreductase [Acidobacteriota bacterium]